MLSFDFTTIRKRSPDREPVWSALQLWAKAHPKEDAVPILELVIDLGGKVDASALLDAIDELVAEGQARKAFRVVDPGMKILLQPSYRTWKEVPERVQNNWDQWIDVTPQNVAMVLESNK